MSVVQWLNWMFDITSILAVEVMLVLILAICSQTEQRFLIPFLVSVEAWLLGDLIANLPVGIDIIYGAITLQLVALSGTVIFLLLLVLTYTDYKTMIQPSLVTFLFAEPIGFTLVVLTDPSQRLVFQESLVGNSMFEAAGPALLCHIVYVSAIVAVVLTLAVGCFFRAKFAYRFRATALVLGVIALILGNVLYFFIPIVDCLAPILFSVTGGLLTYPALRAELLNLSPAPS